MMRQNPHLLLMGSLHFSASDIEANRKGQLSPMQRQRLEVARLRDVYLCVLVLAVVIAVELLTYARLVVVLFSTAVVISVALGVWERASRDLRERVRAVSGHLKMIRRTVRGYEVLLNNEPIRAPRATAEAFADGQLYRVYLTANGALLSAEVLR